MLRVSGMQPSTSAAPTRCVANLRNPIIREGERNFAADSVLVFGDLFQPLVNLGRKVDFTALRANSDGSVININGTAL